MEKTVQQIPFLRSTIALAFGIFIGSVINFPLTVLLAICAALFVSLYFINKNYSFRISYFFGISTHLLFITIGITVFGIYNKSPKFIDDGIYVATVIEKPQEKEKSYKSVIKLSIVKTSSEIISANEKVLVYFEKQIDAKQLQPGNIIVFSASPQLIKNYGNPFEFDYKKYLERKKIYRQLYLSTDNWELSSNKPIPTLTIRAEQFREKLLGIYRNQNFGSKELEILSALTLGYKLNLDRETKRVFSAAGAMHVLAVSGLHVGIVFWVISMLFGFLRKQKTGRIIFVIISILLLWTYALITGLSPSVMRASTMFTIFVIGENINRKPSSYNSLAASAMLLLLLNPNNLFEVSFQLSYSAVFGILFLQPKLSKLVTVTNKIVKIFWVLLTISIAAQIATFPITSFYFNQFPTYFWITNLIIIPAVMVLIPLGMALLVFANISVISTIISAVIQFTIKWIYIIISQIEQFPYSVHEISVLPIQLFFLVGILFAFYLFLNSKKIKYLKVSMVFALFIALSSFAFNLIQNKVTEIIVYNNPKNATIQLIKGKTNFIICEDKTEFTGSFEIHRNSNLRLKLEKPKVFCLKDTIHNNFLTLKNGVLIFEGKTILFNKDFYDFKKAISVDLIINPKNINGIEKLVSNNTSIITTKRFYGANNSNSDRFYQISNRGAFIKEW